ncbi:MAG: carbohydrate kinase family protein [Myxococcaceae bacterium]
MPIVVTGSLAYDYLMTFPGRFREHLLHDRMHRLTVSFLVDDMRKLRGGVAGNIAYSLALLGQRPRLVATAGDDFEEYRGALEAAGVDTSGVKVIPGTFTASCFINTDQDANQLVAFYAGALAHAQLASLDPMRLGPADWVVVSPADPAAMEATVAGCLRARVPYVFDPGKQTPRLEGEQIVRGMKTASVVIGNDYEFGLMAQKTGHSEAALQALAPVAVVTRGELGSTILVRGQPPIDIPTAPIEALVDPTGAGDAYLAGLVFAVARRLPWPVAGRTAALAAAYALEQRGCQEHHYSRSDFIARYRQAFGAADELERALAA